MNLNHFYQHSALRAGAALFILLSATYAQDNLINNGGFEELDPEGFPISWLLPEDFQPGSINVVEGEDSPEGARFLQLNSDPSGGNFESPQVMLSQQLPPLPGDSEEVVLLQFSGWLAVQQQSQQPFGGINFVIRIDAENDPVIVPIQLHRDIPIDSQFHLIEGELELPPEALTDELAQIFIDIEKTQPGLVRVDALELFKLPTDLAPVLEGIEPSEGLQLGGTEVQVFGQHFTQSSKVFFGDVGALVIEQSPTLLKVIAPPLEVTGPVPIEVIDLELKAVTPIQVTFQSQPAFYAASCFPHFDPTDNNLNPTTLSLPLLPTEPKLDFRIDGTSIDEELISASSEETLVVLPDIAVGEHRFSAHHPSGYGSTSPVPIEILPSPPANRLTPSSGAANGGDRCTLLGEKLASVVHLEVGGVLVPWLQIISDTELSFITPPNSSGQKDITLILKNGQRSTPDDIHFNCLENLPGDLNGDQTHTLQDVLLGLQIATGQEIEGAVNLSADANGDGKIDHIDAQAALAKVGTVPVVTLQSLPAPAIVCGTSRIPESCPLIVNVQNTRLVTPCRIHWGDGFNTEISSDGPVTHRYDEIGDYPVHLETAAGFTESQTISVVPVAPVEVFETEIELMGTDLDGQPISGRLARLEMVEGAEPPSVKVSLTTEGTGTVYCGLTVDSPGDSGDFVIPFSVDVDDFEEPSVHSIRIESIPLSEPGEHVLTVQINWGARVNNANARNPRPAIVQLNGFVTTQDCLDIEKQWKALVALKAVKQADGDALVDRWEDMRDEKSELEARLKEAEEKLKMQQEERDRKQKELEELFDSMGKFFEGTAEIVHYDKEGDFPADKQKYGARRANSSGGFGFSFDSTDAFIARNEEYKAAMGGRSVGDDMFRLRQLLGEIDQIDNDQTIADEIARLRQMISDLCDTKIPQAEDDIAQAVVDCENLNQQIKDLVEQHKECLEELEKQREIADKIASTNRALRKTQRKLDNTESEAEEAESVIAGRSGSPSQKTDDQAKVEAGKACNQEAKEKLNAATSKLIEAKNANKPGGAGADRAAELLAEAEALRKMAEEKTEEAKEQIREGKQSALARKRPECVEGEPARVTEVRMIHWHRYYDFSYARNGRSPSDWARFKGNADSILWWLDKASKASVAMMGDPRALYGVGSGVLVGLGFDQVSSGQTVGESLMLIYEDFFDRNGAVPVDLYLRREGTCFTLRTTTQCVDGCYVTTHESINVDPEPVFDEVKVGTIGVLENRAEKATQLLREFKASDRSRRSIPTKDQCK